MRDFAGDESLCRGRIVALASVFGHTAAAPPHESGEANRKRAKMRRPRIF
jgi:hypothetical protein